MKARACVYCKKQGIFWGRSSRSLQQKTHRKPICTPAGHAPQGAVWRLDVRGDFLRNTGRGGIWGSWSLAYNMVQHLYNYID